MVCESLLFAEHDYVFDLFLFVSMIFFVFLKCTETDDKGNYFGIRSLVVTLNKGKRKESYANISSSSLTELHDQLRQKMAEHDEENARRDAEQQQSQTRIANLEMLVSYWKQSDPAFAAFVASQPHPTAPATTPATTPAASATTTTQPDTFLDVDVCSKDSLCWF